MNIHEKIHMRPEVVPLLRVNSSNAKNT